MGIPDELAELTDSSGRSIRRGIQVGLIRGKRTAARAYVVAPGEAQYLQHHWPTLRKLRERLRTMRDVEAAIVFGSLARGDMRRDSDVDILIRLRGEVTMKRVREVRDGLATAVGLPVEVHELRHLEPAPELLQRVIEDGRVLVDRAGVWPDLRRRRHSIRARAERHRQATIKAAKRLRQERLARAAAR
ncbi:MAG: nucleotidyltransferase domain-containing protein [Candidatus Dormiibacterota bacterium]